MQQTVGLKDNRWAGAAIRLELVDGEYVVTTAGVDS